MKRAGVAACVLSVLVTIWVTSAPAASAAKVWEVGPVGMPLAPLPNGEANGKEIIVTKVPVKFVIDLTNSFVKFTVECSAVKMVNDRFYNELSGGKQVGWDKESFQLSQCGEMMASICTKPNKVKEPIRMPVTGVGESVLVENGTEVYDDFLPIAATASLTTIEVENGGGVNCERIPVTSKVPVSQQNTEKEGEGGLMGAIQNPNTAALVHAMVFSCPPKQTEAINGRAKKIQANQFENSACISGTMEIELASKENWVAK